MRGWTRAGLAVAGGMLGAVAAAVAFYATQVEPYWLRIRRRTVSLRGLPEAFDGLTILHLSDFHLAPGDRRGLATARLATRIPADLVALTGDFGDVPADAPIAASLLAEACGRLGTFAVLGNHDFFALPRRARRMLFSCRMAGRVQETLERVGIRVLRNAAAPLEVGGQRLWIVGLDDPHSLHDDVERAFSAVPPGDPAIVLTHSWEPAPTVAERGALLVLAGHTHGGQVRLPLLGAPVHNCHRRPPRASGLIWIGSTALHISPGVGSTEKLRFGIRPEATILRLRVVGMENDSRSKDTGAALR